MPYIGVDIVEIGRIRQAVEQWGDRFLHRVYTDEELRLYRGQPSSLAARFAGKEALVKALGTSEKGIGWKDIEILAEAGGRPVVNLYGKAQQRANELGIKGLAISLSHSREYAVALVVGEAD